MRKSILASLLISMGVYGLLKTDYSYISMILFTFGLSCICISKLYLFTGTCGYIIADIKKHGLKYALGSNLFILLINIIVGYILGYIYSICSPDFTSKAVEIVDKWSVTLPYFIKSFMCGSIMFLAVDTYKKGHIIGILLGVPLFILCGFQHSIANSIILGASHKIVLDCLGLCVLGNWIGAITTYILKDNE